MVQVAGHGKRPEGPERPRTQPLFISHNPYKRDELRDSPVSIREDLPRLGHIEGCLIGISLLEGGIQRARTATPGVRTSLRQHNHARHNLLKR